MGQALYRKYRSKKLSEIIGQEHITKTLERAIKSGKLSHAYLFTGPKGVGKTSIARILAHEVNDLPYTDESIHLDIIEIDAASNRRIDEIRDLRDKVHIAPSSSKYKVYIIDEVHMLTKEAFNALLKTLEEPPAHVIFILATTEAHKLPETIISRTQRFTFKPIEDDKAVEHLGKLAREEGMDIDAGALKLLVEHGRGSFRDSISLLDQIGNSQKTISLKDVEHLLGIAPEKTITELMNSTLRGSASDIVASLSGLTQQGVTAGQTAKQLASTIRKELINDKSSLSRADAHKLLADLLQVSSSPDSEASLELALFDINMKASPHMPAVSVSSEQSQPEVMEINPPVFEKLSEADMTQPAKEESFGAGGGEEPSWWKELLNSVKKDNSTLYGVIRMSKASFNNGTLTLAFNFGFHYKKISDSKSRAIISKIASEISGQPVNVEVLHDKKEPNINSAPIEESVISDAATPDQSDDLQAITSVFGGGEVLET